MSPGFKFNEWELRGAPIRLELGPRDLAAGTAVMVRRLGEGKEPISLDGAPARLADELAAFQDLLLERATAFRDEHTVVTDDWDSFVAAVAVGWALALHCGARQCEEEIKAATGATARCVPLDGAAGVRAVHPLRAAFGLRQAGHLRPRVLAPVGRAPGAVSASRSCRKRCSASVWARSSARWYAWWASPCRPARCSRLARVE